MKEERLHIERLPILNVIQFVGVVDPLSLSGNRAGVFAQFPPDPVNQIGIERCPLWSIVSIRLTERLIRVGEETIPIRVRPLAEPRYFVGDHLFVFAVEFLDRGCHERFPFLGFFVCE